jgi:uncharacterized protein
LYVLLVPSIVFANQNLRRPTFLTPSEECSLHFRHRFAVSPLLATHTDFSPVSPVFATHTKTAGVYTNNSHSGTRQTLVIAGAFSISNFNFPGSLSLFHQSPTDVSFHFMNILLNQVECRVLGSLVEKEITTPEYYPLSLNALVNACNQKSNREPAMSLDEAAVRQALHSLDGQSLVRSVSAADSRVTKYEHRLQEAFNFYRHEIAILCVLLLRGPQTLGELRTRTERMHSFDDLSAVHSRLQHLMKREPPLVKLLPRQPGTKEARYSHLLSGDVESFGAKPEMEVSGPTGSAEGERITSLEEKVSALQKEILDLKQQFATFRKQFE